MGQHNLSRTSLYTAIERTGLRPRVATEQIRARAGTDEECRLLREPMRAVLLTRHRITHDDTGRPIDVGDHAFRASRYTYDMTLVSGRTEHPSRRRARAASNATRRSRKP